MQSPSQTEIGEFRFDPSTGELTDRNSGQQSSRLAPQPAKLLTMLVEKCPEVVTREEIQQSLWPGVRSDFDKNLHFCVRQIRSAFGDSASQPAYVETIPRRGYRLIADVRSIEPVEPRTEPTNAIEAQKLNPSVHLPQTASADKGYEFTQNLESSTAKRRQSTNGGVAPRMLTLVGVFVVLVVVGIAIIQFGFPGGLSSAATEQKTRVAIMPFKSEKAGFEPMSNGEIGVGLLEAFAPELDQIDLIGPTTTETFVAAKKSLKELAHQTEVDFIVNGKYLSIEEENRVLVEIIRAHDGTHVWVKSFDASTSNFEIARLTSEALRIQISDMESTSDCDEQQ